MNHFDSRLNVSSSDPELTFQFGEDVFGPPTELRRLDAIRGSLLDPSCSGPDPVYAIAMDVGRSKNREELTRRMLLFGVVAYAAGQLGREPVRSQGHVHAIAPHCGWSTPELFEIWQGKAVVYAQESASDEPGRCIAVEAGPGDQVVVPPGWAHCVINADPRQRMVFGAWCDRQYGFVYDGVRAHHGVAWFPVLNAGKLDWERNPNYRPSELAIHSVRPYPELGLNAGVPIYEQFEQDPASVQWVSEPGLKLQVWSAFEP
jgi:glucose-6-phosphate isomerase